METQVKERLTGAVILVTLFVLLVPELLTGSAKPAAPQPAAASVEPVEGEPAVRTYSIDLVQGGVKQEAQPTVESDLTAKAVKKPQDELDTARQLPKPAENSPAAELPALQSAATPAGEKPEAVAPARVAAVAEKPVPVRGAAAAVEKPAPVVAPRAAAQPPASKASPTRVASAGGWAVQLGSFASRENAQRLAKQLEGKGYGAFVLEGGGTSGKLYRVRVGPEPDRAAATALAAKLRSAGHKGSVVSP